MIVAIFLALPCAAFGACSVWAGAAFDPRQSGAPLGSVFLLVGLGALAILAGLVFWVVKLWKG